jgi:hypothetical protein
MFNSTVLEVAIGLVFCFASVALITSSVYEAIASWLNLRSKTLFAGIKNLLNGYSPAGNELLLKVYNHALAHPTGNGAAISVAELENKPSYIDPKNFAIALIDAVQSAPNNFAILGSDINDITDPQIKQLMRGMYDRAGGDIENMHKELAAWFNDGMDRVSGTYKRQAQAWCFTIAFVFAAVFNVDSIHLIAALWKHTVDVATISIPTIATSSADAIKGLDVLPIGWVASSPAIHISPLGMDNGVITQFVGWLITATAALFGAPFWFDMLQHLIRIRGTGPKPQVTESAVTTPQKSAQAPSTQSPAIAAERNAVVDLHAVRNRDDESYRPVQTGERW